MDSTILSHITVDVVEKLVLPYMAPRERIKFLRSDKQFSGLSKKYEKEQLLFRKKIQDKYEKVKLPGELGPDDLSKGYNIDWKKAYNALTEEHNIIIKGKIMILPDSPEVPEDEPDYIRMFIKIGKLPYVNNNYILRKATEYGHIKVIKYLLHDMEEESLPSNNNLHCYRTLISRIYEDEDQNHKDIDKAIDATSFEEQHKEFSKIKYDSIYRS